MYKIVLSRELNSTLLNACETPSMFVAILKFWAKADVSD